MNSDRPADEANAGTAHVPKSVSDLKRKLRDGNCYVWHYYNRRLYFDFVEGVGCVRTETDAYGQDPHTMPAKDDEMKAALRFGGVEPIDRDEIPVTEGSA